jgi:transposase
VNGTTHHRDYLPMVARIALRLQAKPAMLAAAARAPGSAVLRTIPFLGPVRVALLLATLQTPWRFRTKRNLWAYAGLAVVTRSSADYTIVDGQAVRRQRAPLTRGLNRHHNRVLTIRLRDVSACQHRLHG